MIEYKAYIKNITTDEWLMNENDGQVEHTKDFQKCLVFHDEADAESTLEQLNMDTSDAYTLLVDDQPVTDDENRSE